MKAVLVIDSILVIGITSPNETFTIFVVILGDMF